MSPDDPRHGSAAGYNAGCRCSPCAIAERRAHKQYHVRRLAMGGSTTVDATRAAEVIREARETMSYSAMAKAISSSHTYVTKIARGEVKRISPEREADILKLATHRPTDTSHINPTGARRRIQALYALGYSFPRIAAETGYGLQSVKKLAHAPWPVIEARNDQAIRDAYDRLSMTLPTSDNNQERSGIARARNAAQRRGWSPPLAWDDDEIDDPKARPRGRFMPKAAKGCDEAVVLRVLAGEQLPTTKAERDEIVRRWVAGGGSRRAICARFGWHDDRYAKEAKAS